MQIVLQELYDEVKENVGDHEEEMFADIQVTVTARKPLC